MQKPWRCMVFLLASSLLAAEGRWEGEGGVRFRPIEKVDSASKPGFTLIDGPAAGIVFTNLLPVERAVGNHNLMNGSGVALGDFDGDGNCDIYFCGIAGNNTLFRNLGNWRFQDVTEQAGLRGGGRPSTGAAFADLNGDGWLDLVLVSCGGPNSLFLNDGKGRFTERPLPPGEVTRTGSTTITLADIDGDGDLDLYIANYGENSITRSGGTPATRIVNGREEVIGRYRHRIKIRPDGKMIELGEPDVLYLNDGKGAFTPVPWRGGSFLDEDGHPLQEAPWDFGLAAMFRDIDGDGVPDLYVCNDFQTPDRIWLNDGRGRFRAIPRLALRHTSNFSMSVDFADIDRDGHVDFVLADMLSRSHILKMVQMDGNERSPHFIGEFEDRPQVRQNSLMLGRGDGTFGDVARFAGVDASDWTWSMIFLDVDLDGYEDLLVGNGHMFDTQDLDAIDRSRALGRQGADDGLKKLLVFPKLETPNYAFRNRGDRTFEETGQSWGFDSKRVSNGMALADLDNDGDLDVVVNCLNAPPLIYRNTSAAPRVAVRLKGSGGNSAGTGSQIVVRGGSVPVQSQEMITGGRYLSGDQAMRVFAAGKPDAEMAVEVTWRSGRFSKVDKVKAGRIYEISEPATPIAPKTPATGSPAADKPIFEDLSASVAHKHVEAVFDDFERQPLLPHRFSQLGPGVAMADLDGDGHDDVWIGAGRGGSLALFQGNGAGVFKALSAGAEVSGLPDDVLGASLAFGPDGSRMFLAAVSNYEQSADAASLLLTIRVQGGTFTSTASLEIPAGITAGPIAVGDMDGDGDLDLFIGGRLKPGRYPEPVPSFLYRQDRGSWVLDPQFSGLPGALVSGATWSDLDGDGFPELILACEWGPVRVFHNNRGTLKEITKELGLSEFSGLWNSVAAADLDGDGRMDLVTGNWGLNSAWQADAGHPLELIYADFDENGVFDMLEAQLEPLMKQTVPLRNLQVVGAAIPAIKTAALTHHAYAEASVARILGEAFGKGRKHAVTTLETTAWLNRGNRFERVRLPAEAQWAPVYGVTAADFDGDGHEDLFLAQNHFAMRAEDARLDSGRGLLLFGDSKGNFRPVSGKESGLAIYGEQRGSACGDFDEDGRPDLLVSQNGAATRLFRNGTGKPGLRVKLAGPPGNPCAMGAQARLHFGTRLGPAREVHGGSGYGSQDSTTLLFAVPEPATKLTVRWPGGKPTTSAVPEGSREIRVDVEGVVTRVR